MKFIKNEKIYIPIYHFTRLSMKKKKKKNLRRGTSAILVALLSDLDRTERYAYA